MQEEIQDQFDREREGRKQSTELLVDTVSPWRTWPISSKLFSGKIIPFGYFASKASRTALQIFSFLLNADCAQELNLKFLFIFQRFRRL